MTHTILFSGHMIDKPDRPSPRFPASKEVKAAQAIEKALKATLVKENATRSHNSSKDVAAAVKAIAAAANGGDILFHEACIRLRIPSEIWLGIPADAFQQTSVAAAGPIWISRYRTLLQKLPVRILHPADTSKAPDSVWEEANQWMLDSALAGP